MHTREGHTLIHKTNTANTDKTYHNGEVAQDPQMAMIKLSHLHETQACQILRCLVEEFLTLSPRPSRPLSKSFDKHAACFMFRRSRYSSSQRSLEKQPSFCSFQLVIIILFVAKQPKVQRRLTEHSC